MYKLIKRRQNTFNFIMRHYKNQFFKTSFKDVTTNLISLNNKIPLYSSGRRLEKLNHHNKSNFY